jgi:bifunctional DNA-binding transcriptional regulator/antitoxin component of YhaV-PrlF toxin-antitoxin module
VVGVTERKIAPLVPPTLARGFGRRLLAGRSAQLPVGELLERPRAGTLVYGMGRLDADGRVANRSTIDALGWTAGDCLNIALVGGSVVVHRDTSGAFAMGSKPYLVLPAALRRRNGLGAGDLVLVAADPNHDVLVVHPLSALDTMITTYHASLTTVADGQANDQATVAGGGR